MELLVTIVIIAVLATIAFTGSDWVMKSARTSRTLEGMRQLAAGTVLYAQDHDGQIPRGDEGADGAGVGGRGVIWINHIASNVGYPELDPSADPPVLLNKSNGGMDQWTYLMKQYKSAPFVCQGFNKAEQAIAKRQTPDAIGGIGYNVQPMLASVGGNGSINASWGSPSVPIQFSRITHSSSRCMYASSYDWHLFSSSTRAYDRFGKNKAAMVFWDGAARLVTKTEYDRAISTPDLPLSR